MLVAVILSVGLLVWSLGANLLLGETLYVVRNLVLSGLLLWLARRAGVSWTTLGLSLGRARAGARWGAVAALVVAFVVGLGTALSDQVPGVGALLADERASLEPGELSYQVLVRIPLGTAVFEELAFRGVLLGLLLRRVSRWAAVGGCSLVFGLWHVAPTIVALRVNEVAPASPEGMLTIVGAVAVTAVAGVLFCLLRLGSGSLIAPVLAHWATNGLGLVAAAATDAG